MDSKEIVSLYEKGYSIEYIINYYYKKKKRGTIRVINCPNGRKIIMNENITKESCRGEVYQILYKNLINFSKDRPI